MNWKEVWQLNAFLFHQKFQAHCYKIVIPLAIMAKPHVYCIITILLEYSWLGTKKIWQRPSQTFVCVSGLCPRGIESQRFRIIIIVKTGLQGLWPFIITLQVVFHLGDVMEGDRLISRKISEDRGPCSKKKYPLVSVQALPPQPSLSFHLPRPREVSSQPWRLGSCSCPAQPPRFIPPEDGLS